MCVFSRLTHSLTGRERESARLCVCVRGREVKIERKRVRRKNAFYGHAFSSFFLRNCYSFEIIKRVQKFEDSLLTWRAAKIRSGAAIHPMQ